MPGIWTPTPRPGRLTRYTTTLDGNLCVVELSRPGVWLLYVNTRFVGTHSDLPSFHELRGVLSR